MCSNDAAFVLPEFTATLLQEEGGTPVVSVFGEVDLCSAHELDVMMLKAIAESGKASSVIVDLGGVAFMDIAGFKILLRAQRVLESSPGGSLNVICSGEIRRLVEITGLIESFSTRTWLRPWHAIRRLPERRSCRRARSPPWYPNSAYPRRLWF